MPFDNSTYEIVTDEVLRCLIEARSRIATGWCPYFESKDGKHCAQGALWASARIDVGIKARDFIISAMDARDVHPVHRNISLMLFNDMGTQDSVLALFDRAIAARREGGR